MFDLGNLVAIALELGKNATFRILLSGGAGNTNANKRLLAPIEWQSNVWQSVFIHLPTLLKDDFTPGEIQSSIVKSLSFTMTNAPPHCRFHLQNVFVFGDWSKNYKFKLNGYDASGIGGTTWTYEGITSLTEFSPENFNAPDAGPGWIIMRLRDKAENLSSPVRLPVCSASVLPTGSFVIPDGR